MAAVPGRLNALETERLKLRPWSPAAEPLFVRLSADPRVMRWIGAGEVRGAEESRAVSARVLEHWTGHGFGWRVAVERATGREVGLISLNRAGPGTPGVDEDEIEIGWWIDPADWGRGLASEGALAVCAEAFGRLGAAGLVARIQPENAGSVRVAARLGMVHELDTTGRSGEPVRVFRLSAARWRSRPTP